MRVSSPVPFALRSLTSFLSRSRYFALLLILSCLSAAPALAVGYTDNSNGTVTDPGTGLTWMRCSMGQTWSSGTCIGTKTSYTWDQAMALAGTVSFASNSDWRLPNVRELQTIVDRSTSNPSINATAFPGAPSSDFWTSTVDAYDATSAWYVAFSYGNASRIGKANTWAVRMVRGGQSSALLSAARPTADYVDNADGTTTHTPTGLMWQRCAVGQSWDGTTCSGTAATQSWDLAKALTSTFAGKSDWRLPTQDELLSLVDYTLYGPTINTTIFPNTPGSVFWSSTPNVYSSGWGWGVYFYFGFTDGYFSNYAARLVRSAGAGSTTTTTAATTTTTTAATTTTTASTTTTTLAGFANTLGNMADARYMHTATLLPGGKVLVAGGWYQLKGAELYDPVAKTFTPTGAMSATLGRGDHTATLLPNGKVLVAGGSDPQTHQYFASAELYDPATGTFSPTGSMTTTRSTHTATLLPNGKVLIAGGATADSAPTNSAEIYDPATGTFTATGSMTTNRTSHAAVLLKNGKVLIAAGSYYYGYSNTAEIFDPATGAFTGVSGAMTSSRAWGLSATLMNDGRVLIAGGGNAAYLNSAEIFDPSSNQFSATGTMRDARRVHTATLLPDGRVLIAGGQNTNTTRIAGVEIFDPATGVFTAAANMSTERSGHTATLLPNGQVLIAGGANNTILVNSAELYGAGTTAAFYDNFDVLNTANWWLARGSNNDLFGEGEAFDASGVAFANGYAKLNADITDQVGVMYSRPLPVTKGDIVTIKRRVFVHAENRYYAGAFNIYEVADPALSAAKTNTFAPLFGMMYANYTYQTDLNLFSLLAKGRLPYGPGDYSGGTAPHTAPLWDQWFDEEFIYDSATGETIYKINGQEKMRTQANALAQPYIKIMMHTYGWYTGHYMMVDSLSVETKAPGAPGTNVLSGGRTIAAGNEQTCALTAAGGVKCWGYNSQGQLGDNTTITRTTPVDVVGLASGAAAVAAGYYHNCALTTAGGAKCWGENMFGKLGDSTDTPRRTPVDVSGLTSGVAAITGGAYHTCALTTAGGVKCWGYNTYGQLGDNTNTEHYAPADVPGLTSGVVAIAAGENHTCAVTAAGGVKCWGYNAASQLGDATTTNRNTPVDVLGLNGGVTAVAAGQYHTCALTADGGIKCWGGNGAGQLGDGTTTTRSTPVAVANLPGGVLAISLGSSHTCALTAAGGMKCWGGNNNGELGDTTTLPRAAPVDVSGLTSGVSAIAAGYFHTCAVTTAGGVKCWGSNYYGELGDGTTTSRATPADVPGIAGMPGPSSSTTTTTSTTSTSATTTTTGSTTTTTLSGGGITLNLLAGWNLVGNSGSTAIDVTSLLGDSSKVTTVWKWVAAKLAWAFYTPTLSDGGVAYGASKGYDPLTTVNGGEGFWVNAKSNFSVQWAPPSLLNSVTFQTQLDGTSALVTGWNLIAVGDSPTPSVFNKALSYTPPATGDIPINLTTLWAWDAALANWYFYAPSLEKSGGLAGYIASKNYLDFGTKVLDPVTGFWLNKP